ncbi:MAG: hypothetical protein QGI58_00810 [Candidatus Thalassarchaeaceae archaeon]|jgi:hypothetical protein|nr:hypothetical protein [Candidatus Thalassarchaeaceae archaeon]
MEGAEYFGKAKSGVVISKPPLEELIIFTILLTPFLLLFSSPFWLFLAFPEDLSFQETAICGIPSFFATWIVGFNLFRLWSKSVVSIDVDRNEVAFKQSLIVTPGIYWRTVKQPLSEVTNIESGKRVYWRQKSDEQMDFTYGNTQGLDEDKWYKEMERMRKNDPNFSKRKEISFFVKLHGYSILQGKPWDLEISEVICRGWSKTPDLELVRELAKLLGLPSPRKEEVFPDGEPKKQVMWPILIVPMIIICMAIFVNWLIT